MSSSLRTSHSTTDRPRFAPLRRVALAGGSRASASGPKGLRGLVDALGPERGRDEINRCTDMRTDDRPGPGICQSIPRQRLGSPLSCAKARMLSAAISTHAALNEAAAQGKVQAGILKLIRADSTSFA